MPRAKRSIEASVTVDDVALVWHLHREQLWCPPDGWRGMAIHVRVAELTRRELYLEYPAFVTQKAGFMRMDPPRPNILPAKVAVHIRQAMEAGWDPGSRGKPFVFEVEELPS